MRFFTLSIVALGVSIGVAPATARAQAIPSSNGDGFDTHLFRPALDARGFVSVNGVDVPKAGTFGLGLTLDYGRNLLRAEPGALVRHSFTGTFTLSYALTERALVGVSAPVVLMSGDAESSVPGWGPGALDAQSFGWVALHGKVKLTSATSPIGVAVAGQVGVPVSDAPRNAGADPSLWYWPSLILEKRFGPEDRIRVALNAGWRGHSPSTTTLALADGRVRDGSLVTYGAGASVRVAEPLDLVVETYGTYLLADAGAAVRPSNEALGGIKLFVEKSSHLVIAAGPRYTAGFEAADLRGVIGFVFEPPAGEREGTGAEEEADDDDDGIPNAEDACPYVKGPRTGDPRTNGCPPLPEPTPPIDDPDHDGIATAEDACPNDFGLRHPNPKRNGCPDVVVGPTELVFFDPIQFKTASAEILPESNPILDKIAKALDGHPEITLVEVAGHADERGGAQMNLSLTQARVDSVMRALVARGIERSRLRAKGYGFYCPKEEGHDEEAWKANRRVELVIVKTKDGPTGAPLGCANAAAHGVIPAPVPE